MLICLFVNEMYKQIITVFLSLLLCAFPSCSPSLIQVRAKHGPSLFSAKAKLSSFSLSHKTANEDSLAFTESNLRSLRFFTENKSQPCFSMI